MTLVERKIAFCNYIVACGHAHLYITQVMKNITLHFDFTWLCIFSLILLRL